MSAYTLHLGWFTSGVLFTVIFAIPMVARRVFGLNEVFAFWFAYIITRPLGASYADWLGVPQSLGGLNYGRGTVAVGLTIAIIAWVSYLWVTKVDVERGSAAPAGASSPALQTELDGPREVSLRVADHRDRSVRVGDGRRTARVVDHVQDAAPSMHLVEEDRQQIVHAAGR